MSNGCLNYHSLQISISFQEQASSFQVSSSGARCFTVLYMLIPVIPGLRTVPAGGEVPLVPLGAVSTEGGRTLAGSHVAIGCGPIPEPGLGLSQLSSLVD